MARKRPNRRKRDWGRGQARSEPTVPTGDYLLEAAQKNWPHILMMYRIFEDKKPVMLLDIQDGKIYAYPYREFKENLSERSQQLLQAQYEEALRDGQIVVFVRDNEQERLRSFLMDPD